MSGSMRARCCRLTCLTAALTGYLPCTLYPAPSLLKPNTHLKAATSCVGSFWMNPTVSDTRISLLPGSRTLRVVGSRVANSLSSANTPALVSVFSRVDLPADS